VRDKTQSSGDGDAPVKECPECQSVVHAALRFCSCGHKFPDPKFNHADRAYGGAVLSSQVVAEWVDVDYVNYYRHKKEGKPDSVKVTYGIGMKTISEWLCPDHGGYAASRYRARMAALGATALTTDDALDEAEIIWTIPNRIKIKPRVDNPKFDEIIQLDYSGGRKPEKRGEDLGWGINDGNGVSMQELLEEIPF